MRQVTALVGKDNGTVRPRLTSLSCAPTPLHSASTGRTRQQPNTVRPAPATFHGTALRKTGETRERGARAVPARSSHASARLRESGQLPAPVPGKDKTQRPPPPQNCPHSLRPEHDQSHHWPHGL